ncbi:CLUMA_CG003888, isoform A [Clunio marinus]|uniref:CLUMA_CG003888, isoform A n=1 Tax=Clunio marinus TaxID=568069 RepID=A0A1J1HUJ5_9DIPT|nr:CLUMA_CG003888, isoform A [Clunio marinus]
MISDQMPPNVLFFEIEIMESFLMFINNIFRNANNIINFNDRFMTANFLLLPIVSHKNTIHDDNWVFGECTAQEHKNVYIGGRTLSSMALNEHLLNINVWNCKNSMVIELVKVVEPFEMLNK